MATNHHTWITNTINRCYVQLATSTLGGLIPSSAIFGMWLQYRFWPHIYIWLLLRFENVIMHKELYICIRKQNRLKLKEWCLNTPAALLPSAQSLLCLLPDEKCACAIRAPALKPTGVGTAILISVFSLFFCAPQSSAAIKTTERECELGWWNGEGDEFSLWACVSLNNSCKKTGRQTCRQEQMCLDGFSDASVYIWE